mmetsp:Transcript_3177/g.9011  ORF Transcript_3177/g.9011 Transcript_3177/m.9011 type:complete len:304 (-) Transcript_3177:4877-5788(-)
MGAVAPGKSPSWRQRRWCCSGRWARWRRGSGASRRSSGTGSRPFERLATSSLATALIWRVNRRREGQARGPPPALSSGRPRRTARTTTSCSGLLRQAGWKCWTPPSPYSQPGSVRCRPSSASLAPSLPLPPTSPWNCSRSRHSADGPLCPAEAPVGSRQQMDRYTLPYISQLPPFPSPFPSPSPSLGSASPPAERRPASKLSGWGFHGRTAYPRTEATPLPFIPPPPEERPLGTAPPAPTPPPSAPISHCNSLAGWAQPPLPPPSCRGMFRLGMMKRAQQRTLSCYLAYRGKGRDPSRAGCTS